MDKDKIVEELNEGGISEENIKKILDIIEKGGIEKEENETLSMENLVNNLEIAMILEKDPIKKTQLAAKIISLKLS